MHIQQAEWTAAHVEPRRAWWLWSSDLLVVVMMCLVFGLQILTVMQCVGGPEAYRMVASDGMQISE